MDASTQVAPMPVLHSVMMLKVSEASRATSVTRAAAAAAAATSRRNSLSLQHALLHVQAAESAAAAVAAAAAASSASAAPMTPHAVASSKPALPASSPRDPSSKVAATSPPLFAKQSNNFAVSPLKLHHHPPVIQTQASLASNSDDSTPSSPDASPMSKRSRVDSIDVPLTPMGLHSPKSSSPKSSGKANTGRWTDAEHKLFLKGLETFPYRAWKKIATLIKTRTVVQIRTHAQKYYQKLEKEEARLKDHVHAHHHQYASSSYKDSATDASEFSDASTTSSFVNSPRPTKKKSMLRKRKFTLDDDDDDVEDDADVASSFGLRIASIDDSMAPLPSLPKRMMKEKKLCARMSPKQKAPVSTSSSNDTSKSFSAYFSSPEMMLTSASSHRAVFGGRGAAAANKIPLLPLSFDDMDDNMENGADADAAAAATERLILDFTDDKSLIVEYPFHHLGEVDGMDVDGMDPSNSCSSSSSNNNNASSTSLDQSLALSSMDTDDLLQLTDEETLDWFSSSTTATTNSVDNANDVDATTEEELLTAAAAAEPLELVVGVDTAEDSAAALALSLEASELTLGRYHFPSLYTDDCLPFADASLSSASNNSNNSSELTPVLLVPRDDAETFLVPAPIDMNSIHVTDVDDDDDDFVLDPEKFLSSYLSPAMKSEF